MTLPTIFSVLGNSVAWWHERYFSGIQWKLDIIDFQWHNYRHLPHDISFKSQSSIIVFHYITIWMQNLPESGWNQIQLKGWYCKLIFIKSVNRKSYHIDIKYHITLTTMFPICFRYSVETSHEIWSIVRRDWGRRTHVG